MEIKDIRNKMIVTINQDVTKSMRTWGASEYVRCHMAGKNHEVI
jgi:hypothetical protein